MAGFELDRGVTVSLGKVHHLLDRNCDQYPFRERLEALCEAIANSKNRVVEMQIVVDADPVDTDAETAWAMCVVASELMADAFRRASYDSSFSVVRVSLREAAGWLFLAVADGDVNSVVGDDGAHSSERGLKSVIVTELVDRLGGLVTQKNAVTGNAVTIVVPHRSVAQFSHHARLWTVQ